MGRTFVADHCGREHDVVPGSVALGVVDADYQPRIRSPHRRSCPHAAGRRRCGLELRQRAMSDGVVGATIGGRYR